MTSDRTTSPSSWQGHLDLSYVYSQGTTRPHRCFAQAPLKVQRPFYPEGTEICHSVILHTAGGMVRGDRLSLNLDLAPEAKALVTTAAASKIYGRRSSSVQNPLVAAQTIQIRLAAGAYLEWLPQETIVFNGAVYQQKLDVDLAPGATFLSWEITRFGRTASGEAFREGNWRSQTQVWQQGSALWIDPQFLPGGSELLQSPHGLAGQPVVASLAWLGQPVPGELLDQVRHQWAIAPRQGEAGVTTLPSGLLCRYRGPSTGEARTWLTQVWQLLRLRQQRSACPPRVWP